MKNIYDVLKQKESEIQQLQKEIEALRIAATLLADDTDARPVAAAAVAAPTPVLTPVRNTTPVIKEAAHSGTWDSSSRQFP
jgi:hypothetical protein